MFTKNQIVQYDIIQTDDPDPDCLDKTSYNLRLGSEYCLIRGTEDGGLSLEDCSSGMGILTIPPFSCALVSTHEWLKVPDKVCGRWGLKIKYALSGLIFQAGPQIEPEYQGKLFGLLFNLSSTEQQISFKEPIWSIDFQRFGTGKITVPKEGTPLKSMREFTKKGIPRGTISELWHESKKTLAKMETRLEDIVREKREIQNDKEKLQNLIIQKSGNHQGVLMIITTLVLSIVLPLVITKTTYDKDDEIALIDRSKLLFADMEKLKTEANAISASLKLLRDNAIQASVAPPPTSSNNSVPVDNKDVGGHQSNEEPGVKAPKEKDSQ